MRNNDLSEMIRKYKALFITAFIIGLPTIVYFVGVSPTLDAITETKTAIQQNQEDYQKLVAKENVLKSFKTQVYASQTSTFENAISPTINLPLILATLQKVATDTGVTLGELSISSTSSTIDIISTQAGKISSFEFKVELTGSFDQIQTFVRTIHQYEPLMSVESISVSSNKTTMVIRYYFQPASLQKTADIPVTALTPKDEATLNAITALNPPVITDQTSTTSASRDNPFK